MGFDCIGKKPTAEIGQYFQRNVWWWRPLAEFIQAKVPDIAHHCQYWQSNDGDGLTSRRAVLLADRLDVLFADGTAARYVADRDARLSALPRVKCKFCNGTGIRTDDVGESQGMSGKKVEAGPDDEQDNPRLGLKGWCNGCNGWGTTKDMECWYYMLADDVKEFADFARHSGGFKIC